MTRVASLYLPMLPIERLRRAERSLAPPEPRARALPPVDDDPGACSVPRGGGWRPGARWAWSERARDESEADIEALPAHQRPSMRELGRRSEAAEHPFVGRRGRGAPSMASQPASAAEQPPAAPLILVAKVGARELTTALCHAARGLGLTIGMAASQARALVPGLDVRPADPNADAALLERLALHAVRHWTPTAARSGPDGLWLELTGVTHLFGGEERFCWRLMRFLARLGLTARVAVASTAGAAYALARYAASAVTIVPAGDHVEAVAPLPLAALRLEPAALTAAARFGLERVADLLPLPRGPLARRLGLPAIARLDQAVGRVAEPITGVVPFEAPCAERRLLEPIGTAEAIMTIIGDLVPDLVGVLHKRGLGARALRLALERVDGTEQVVAAGTSRATRDGPHLARLLAMRIDRIDPGFGIEAVRLTAVRAEPLGAQALASGLAGDGASPDLAPLVDQLAGRVGERRLFRYASLEADVPERAVARVGALEPAGCWPAWHRPVRLLHRPEPLSRVVALLPDHPPRRFEWRGSVHSVVAGDGPERIHGEWWRREGEVWAVRDYFRVEDDRGHRFWLFRRGDGIDVRTGGRTWHMHGFFG